MQLDTKIHMALINLGLLCKEPDDMSAAEAECFKAAALFEEKTPREHFG